MLAAASLGNLLHCARHSSQKYVAIDSLRLPWTPITTGPALYFAVPSTRTIREIEIKLSVVNLPALIGRLKRLGAIVRGRVLERNTLYDTPGSDLRRGGCLLRLRLETPAASPPVRAGLPRAVLTFKAPLASKRQNRYKEKLERELVIRHPGRLLRTLKELDFRPGFRYEKYRTSWRLPGLHLDLDETPVGNFLELEGLPTAIERVADTLGYAHRDYLRTTYWELYAADCERKGRVATNMMFDT